MINTTLKVKENTLEKLKKLKKHPRASYDEVITMLLEQRKGVKSS